MVTERSHYSVTVNECLEASLLVSPEESESNVAMVKHRLPPKRLGGPMHRHANEDEISHVLEGVMGLKVEDRVITVRSGEQVVKERGNWHTYWNPGEEPLVFLEVIAPGGFAGFFEELARVQPEGGTPNEEQLEQIARLNEKYDLEANPESIPGLIEEHDLRS